ncbi:hypothetical protein CF642_38060 [Burkholderia pseudomallei]|nr:hypothetical protein CF642_38060 [Burkholderia pseudomallei]
MGLLGPDDRPTVVHQAGAKHIDTLKENYEAAGRSCGSDVALVPFIDDMASAYADAMSSMNGTSATSLPQERPAAS